LADEVPLPPTVTAPGVTTVATGTYQSTRAVTVTP